MKLSEELKFLDSISIDQKQIASQILPEVQQLVLNQLRPPKETLQMWRCSVDGRKHFEKYINSNFEYELSRDFLRFAWDYYNLNTSNIRNPDVKRRFLNMEKVGMECKHCHTNSGDFEVDHKIPLSKGGKDEIENLQILCKKCNRKKSGRFDFKSNVLMM